MYVDLPYLYVMDIYNILYMLYENSIKNKNRIMGSHSMYVFIIIPRKTRTNLNRAGSRKSSSSNDKK